MSILNDEERGRLLLRLEVACDIRPGVVLVGDRGGGQMTIVSALSGLPFSAEAGKLGRCPILIRTSPASSFQWDVHVLYDHEPSRARAHTWEVVPRMVCPVASGDKADRSAVSAVRLSQLQALRPKEWKAGPRDDDDIVTESQFAAAEYAAQRQFTPNTVALRLRGPSLSKLSIYVLPDLCSNPIYVADQEGPGMAKSFATENISLRGTKALLCMSTFESITNSTAFAAISQAGLMGHTDVLVSEEGGPPSFAGVQLRYVMPLRDGSDKSWLEATVRSHMSGYIRER